MLQCLVPHSFLFNFQINGYDGNGDLVNHNVGVFTNEPSHSCLIGF
jgi:hypothetical protein